MTTTVTGSAFLGHERIATGTLSEIVGAVKAAWDGYPSTPVLV